MSTESENPGDGSRAEPARRALESLAEMEPELRSAALFAGNAADGKLLAADGAASEGEFDSAHVALEQGEAFVLAESGYTLVWTTGRFVLASLTRFDARMCLRDLAAEDPGPGAEN